jgi:2-oxoglutarate dehydrogenase E2 component (dihydrolipoamide succinyltransferase)
MSIVEMRVPTIGESVTEVTLSEWLIKDGDYVELDQPICEFESDKATLEFPAEAAGKLIHVAKEEDDLEIGALVARIDTSVSAPTGGNAPKSESKEEKGESPASTPAPEPAPATSSKGAGIASPAAAKILREADLEASAVNGSGKDGRVTKEDAMKAVADQSSAPAPSESAPAKSVTISTPGERNERREKMSRMRRTIAKRLVSAKNNTAMLTTFNEVDLSNVMAMRKKYQEKFVEKYGIKLGFMSLFAKACANALMEFPMVNAHLDGDHVIYHDYVDISVAISTPTGLVVPPIRNVESKGLHEFELELKALAEKARNGSLSLEEMTGGTFTITNGGIFGSMMSTPILNEPQSAILGMHAIQQRPVVRDGEIVVRPMMYLAMSYDHRIIDGSTSVTFLVKVKEQLEDPLGMFMGLL